MSVPRVHQLVAALAALLLTLGACASSEDGAQVSASVDGGPISTTPPLAVPPVLGQSSNSAAAPVATTAPIEAPVAPPTAVPSIAASQPAAAEPTAEPADEVAEVAEPTDTGAVEQETVEGDTLEEDAVVEPAPVATSAEAAATPVPATPVPATPAPADPTAVPDQTQEQVPVQAEAPEPAAPTGPVIPLGDFEVVNLGTGATQNIAELSPSGATMLWFWAPHLTTCQLEAPSVVQFARDHPSVNIIGMGAGSAANGDSLDGAYQFVERFGTTSAGITMLYDVSFRAWRNFRVSTQPWVVLFDAQGEQIFSSPGRIDLDSVAVALGV